MKRSWFPSSQLALAYFKVFVLIFTPLLFFAVISQIVYGDGAKSGSTSEEVSQARVYYII